MSAIAPITAVVPAAGSSQRMGFNKLFTPVNGTTVLQLTLQQILKSPLVAEIIVVVSTETRDAVENLLKTVQPPSAQVRVVLGGAERQDSVLAGLRAVSDTASHIMIHDAARPFVTAELIELVYQAALKTGAAVCGYPSTDTLKAATPESTIAATVDRETTWAVQTPQIFRRDLIQTSYERAIAGGMRLTDDTAAVSATGHPVQLVRYDGLNVKVTRPCDWDLVTRMTVSAEEDLKTAMEFRKLIHDISNQITSVMGFAFLMEMDVSDDSPLRDHIKALNESSQKCHAIVGSMQTLARDFHTRKQELIHRPDQVAKKMP